MKMDQNTFPFLVLLLCASFSLTVGEPIRCETSGTVPEGSPATLTCVFDKTDKADFMVYRTKSENANEMILALCGWAQGKLDCRHFDGFRFEAEDSNGRVTFESESAKLNQSGTYLCKTLPASESVATDCTLTVQKNSVIDNIIGCHTTSASTGKAASVSCTFPKSIGRNGIILEKFNDNNGRRKDEIARCEKGGGCMVKEGYEKDYKTPTELKVNIPHVSEEQAGIYVCRSPLLPGVTDICTLSLSTDESNGGTSRSLELLLAPMYAILGCFVLLLIAAAILGYAYFQRSSSPSSSAREGGGKSKDENEKKGSQKPLLWLTRQPKG